LAGRIDDVVWGGDDMLDVAYDRRVVQRAVKGKNL
jgi:hypothetical protein